VPNLVERLRRVRDATANAHLAESDPRAVVSVRAGKAMMLALTRELLNAADEGMSDTDIREMLPLAFAFVFNATLFCSEFDAEAADKLFAAVRKTTGYLGDGDPRRLPSNLSRTLQ
jgi:hypothetical protein